MGTVIKTLHSRTQPEQLHPSLPSFEIRRSGEPSVVVFMEESKVHLNMWEIQLMEKETRTHSWTTFEALLQSIGRHQSALVRYTEGRTRAPDWIHGDKFYTPYIEIYYGIMSETEALKAFAECLEDVADLPGEDSAAAEI